MTLLQVARIFSIKLSPPAELPKVSLYFWTSSILGMSDLGTSPYTISNGALLVEG